MPNYIYSDEDNEPMYHDLIEDDAGHNPTVYTSYAEMRAAEKVPFSDPPEEPPNGCWNCFNFDWKREACTAGWNNMDESYYNPDTDDRELTDWCEMHDKDPDIDWREVFEDEPDP